MGLSCIRKGGPVIRGPQAPPALLLKNKKRRPV
jgi:hypothetical protein